MIDKPIYKACWKELPILMPNGAYSFARCTLLVSPGLGHEGPCKFAFTIYEMIKTDRVTL